MVRLEDGIESVPVRIPCARRGHAGDQRGERLEHFDAGLGGEDGAQLAVDLGCFVQITAAENDALGRAGQGVMAHAAADVCTRLKVPGDRVI